MVRKDGMSTAPKLSAIGSDHGQIVSLLKSFHILSSLPDQMINHLAQAARVIELPQDSELLAQNQSNEHLYFLIEGKLGVYVDGGRVSTLQNSGDLVGEMSVITNKPSSATIISETDAKLVRIDSQVFTKVQGPDRELYLYTLYRIYATVLAEKLAATNQKAKRFEELSHNLEKKVEERTQKLEQQNAELLASKNKMEELLNARTVVLRKLNELNENQLVPLKNYLDEFRRQHPDDVSADQLRKSLFEAQALIAPIAEQYSSEQIIQSKRVLLADTNKKQQVIAKMALGGTGVILDMVSTVEEGAAKLSECDYDLIVFDPPNIELANLANQKNIQTVLMTSDQVPNYLPALKKLSVIPAVVSRNDVDRTFTVKNIVTTVTKILSRDIFGIEKYLSWGVDVQTLPVVSSKQRAEVTAQVIQYFEKLGVRRANRDRIATVLEEMLMNAIYDAPVDHEGKPIYNHLSRTVELTLKPEQQGIVRFATDGMLIGVSVRDPFGSFNGSTLLRYLEANYAGSAQDLNAKEGKGGAGRGLHQIVENSDLVVFNIEPKKRTEVIALFNVEVKEKIDHTPSFHLFVA